MTLSSSSAGSSEGVREAEPSRCSPLNCLSDVDTELNNSAMLLGQLRWKSMALLL